MTDTSEQKIHDVVNVVNVSKPHQEITINQLDHDTKQQVFPENTVKSLSNTVEPIPPFVGSDISSKLQKTYMNKNFKLIVFIIVNFFATRVGLYARNKILSSSSTNFEKIKEHANIISVCITSFIGIVCSFKLVGLFQSLLYVSVFICISSIRFYDRFGLRDSEIKIELYAWIIASMCFTLYYM
jgi:hypothetical protein